jgi:hypothetical protein
MLALGDNCLAYNVVKSANMVYMDARDLQTSTTTPVADLGSFVSGLDGRMRLVETTVVLGQKKTWTTSFNQKTMECLGCEKHINKPAFPKRGSGIKGDLQTVWLTDQ